MPGRKKTMIDSYPTWITDDIKIKILMLKNTFYRQSMRHQRQIVGLLKIEELSNETSNRTTNLRKNTINILTQT